MKISKNNPDIMRITKGIPSSASGIRTGAELLKTGRLLCEAATLLSPRRWNKWVNEELGYSVFMANQFIRAVILCNELPQLINLDAVIILKLSELPQAEFEELITSVTKQKPVGGKPKSVKAIKEGSFTVE
jgi:hypothetical protein